MKAFLLRSALATLAIVSLGVSEPATSESADSLAEQNEALLRDLERVHALTPEEMAEVRAVFSRSPFISQGNPSITRHPATEEECRAKLESLDASPENAEFDRICGSPYMAPLYDPATQTAEEALACIDRFEFPDIPCAYPVVWVRAKEAAELCWAVGKRLCDAHEWEGACAGTLQPPDYRFDLAVGVSASDAVNRMRKAHNQLYSQSKSWGYGPSYEKGVCAAASFKSADCEGGSWQHCGSNTYPSGMFPDCTSALGVFDLHGNAAEHMNLPLAPDQMSSTGSQELGVTEMKGSWFIFDTYYAHEDWCRWRAPYWHGSRVMSADSHHNYHLGFRCCKTVDP